MPRGTSNPVTTRKKSVDWARRNPGHLTAVLDGGKDGSFLTLLKCWIARCCCKRGPRNIEVFSNENRFVSNHHVSRRDCVYVLRRNGSRWKTCGHTMLTKRSKPWAPRPHSNLLKRGVARSTVTSGTGLTDDLLGADRGLYTPLHRYLYRMFTPPSSPGRACRLTAVSNVLRRFDPRESRSTRDVLQSLVERLGWIFRQLSGGSTFSFFFGEEKQACISDKPVVTNCHTDWNSTNKKDTSFTSTATHLLKRLVDSLKIFSPNYLYNFWHFLQCSSEK